jgi:cytochrome c
MDFGLLLHCAATRVNCPAFIALFKCLNNPAPQLYSHQPPFEGVRMTHRSTMIKTLSITLAATTIALSAPAFASKELANSKNCLSCHNVEKKVIGPSIKSIAEKYPSADAAKIAALAKKVREGGAGVWGAIPMAANPQVNAAESETLVKWFLTGGK